jgi:excisionase family DNA binding protein
MEWMTTKNAAALLGVTDIRVRQYIDEGRLMAEKFGPLWMVSAASVKGFKRRGPGRPTAPPRPKRSRKKGVPGLGKIPEGRSDIGRIG